MTDSHEPEPGGPDLDTALAAYGEAVRHRHRRVDPRAIVDGPTAVAPSPTTIDAEVAIDLVTPPGPPTRHPARVLLAVAAVAGLLIGVAAAVRASSGSPVSVGAGDGEPAPPATASPGPPTTALPTPTPTPTPTSTSIVLPPDINLAALAAITPYTAEPCRSTSVESPDPPAPARPDQAPEVVDDYTSPDGDRHLSFTFVPTGGVVVDPMCHNLYTALRPMYQLKWSTAGSFPASYYVAVDEEIDWSRYPYSPGPVHGRGGTTAPGFSLGLLTAEPQVASLQVDIRQVDGSVATETFHTHDGHAAVLARQADDVLSDLRYYDAAGNLLGTRDRRQYIPR